MELEKLITINKNLTAAVSTVVNEYDIKAAHPTAMRYISGESAYRDLMKLPKLERNTLIGKMMRDDKTLYPKIEKLLLSWMNEFLKLNDIKNQQFVETTRDSILLVNKIPTVTEFDDGKIKFVNKDGTYTSLFRIQNRYLVLFDSLSYSIRIKGIDSDTINESPFVNKYFKNLISMVESNSSIGVTECMKKMAQMRNRYINTSDPEIYKDILNKNQFMHDVDGEIIFSDYVMDSEKLIKSENYKNFVVPVMRTVLSV